MNYDAHIVYSCYYYYYYLCYQIHGDENLCVDGQLDNAVVVVVVVVVADLLLDNIVVIGCVVC